MAARLPAHAKKLLGELSEKVTETSLAWEKNLVYIWLSRISSIGSMENASPASAAAACARVSASGRLGLQLFPMVGARVREIRSACCCAVRARPKLRGSDTFGVVQTINQ